MATGKANIVTYDIFTGKGIPFTERKSSLRGALDLVTGAYPRFLFGGPVGRRMAPVFHFHDVTRASLEPRLRRLAENGYRTITSEELARWTRDGVYPGDGCVALCFDDAWASLWFTVYPLLKQYGLKAVAYAIPGRVEEADAVREKPEGSPFATWPELRAMSESGAVDVQAHTWSHAMVFCDDKPMDFVRPGGQWPELAEPLLKAGERPMFYREQDGGAPLFTCRSRMSDARRFLPDEDWIEICRETVRRNGGHAFFEQADWKTQLLSCAGSSRGRFETDEERAAAWRFEAEHAREVLKEKLPGADIRQICLPWAVCGEGAEQAVKEAGYATAVADSFPGVRAAVHGRPYRIMRLKHQYLSCLPGRERRYFWSRWTG